MPWPSKLSRGCPMTMPLWTSIPAHNPNAWISTRVCGGPREAHCGCTWRSTRLAVPFRGQTMEVRGPARSFHVATLWVLVEPCRGHPVTLRGQFVGVRGGFVDKCGPAVDIRGRVVGLHPSVRGHILEARGCIVDAYRGPTPDHVDVRRGRASSRAARLRCVDVPLDTRSYLLSSKRQKERSHRDLKKGEKDFLRIICRHKKVALPLCQISVRCRCKGFNAKFMKGFHTATYTQCVFCEQVVARSVWSAERFT